MKIETQVLKKGLVIGFFFMGTSGCYKSPVADQQAANQQGIAAKNETNLETVPQFPMAELKNMRFPSVSLFLWKDKIKSEDIAEALRTSRSMENLESQNFLLNDLLTQYFENQNHSLLPQIDLIIKNDCPALAELKTEEELIQFDRSECIGVFFERTNQEGLKLLEKLNSYAEFFENGSAPAIVFDVKLSEQGEEQLVLSFYDINLPGEKNIKSLRSSTDESIKSLSYSPRGGVINFQIDQKTPTALESISYTYHFSLKRSGFRDPLGRTIFTGDIVVKKMPEAQIIRRGYIKISNRAN
jgi:hypothetical protein